MKKLITEEERQNIIKAHNLGLLTENLNISGRQSSINPDGTVTISDRNGRPQKIRMSLTTWGDINIANIQPVNGGYEITGKKGVTQFVENDKITKVIQFVDTNSPNKIESGSWSTPDLLLQKV